MEEVTGSSPVETTIFSFLGSLLKYDLFLFDADDTLFDFGKSEVEALRLTFDSFEVDLPFDEIYQTYKIENGKLWRALELGQTSKDHLQVERFRQTVLKLGLDVNFENLSRTYLETLPEQVHLNESAFDICQSLSRQSKVGIVTNGIESVQRRRLEKSGLSDFIEVMIVSEECGHAKPDPRFFEYTMKRFPGYKKEQVLVIGDRIETDIEGAHRFGMDACWYNPKNQVSSFEVSPKYQISQLSEIHKIVEL